MKRILSILASLIVFASSMSYAQDLPLWIKQWYGIGVIGEPPETSSYNTITDQTAYLTGLVNAAGNTCFAGAAAASCYMYVSLTGALGAIDTKAMDGTAITTTDIGLEVISANYFWSKDQFEVIYGDELSADDIPVTTDAPYVGNFLHLYDSSGVNWDRATVHDAGDSLGPTPSGLDALSHNLFYDGTNYRRWLGTTAADNLAIPTAPWTLSVMMADDGTNLDMLKVGDSSELLVKKESINTYSPEKTTTSNVGTAATTVLASTEVLGWPNWCVYLENDDGADPFTDADVQVSPDGSTWISLTWTSCDDLAAGSACVYCVTNAAYRYVRVQVAAADANQVDVDAWITANIN